MHGRQSGRFLVSVDALIEATKIKLCGYIVSDTDFGSRGGMRQSGAMVSIVRATEHEPMNLYVHRNAVLTGRPPSSLRMFLAWLAF
jgi:hypothetical protein